MRAEDRKAWQEGVSSRDETSGESTHKPSDRTRRHARADCWRKIALDEQLSNLLNGVLGPMPSPLDGSVGQLGCVRRVQNDGSGFG